MVDAQSHDITTFPSSSVLDVSDVDGMAPFDSIDGDGGASNNEQQWSDHSHFFFTAQQQARFWMASVFIAVLLHKLFRSSGKKELAAGKVLGSAAATAPVTAATHQGKEPNESNSLTSNVVESKDDRLTPSTEHLDQTILLHDASSHIHSDSNDKDCNKPTTSSRGKKSKKLIHKDAASIRNYDKLVTTCTMNEDENLSLSTPPMDKKQDFMASQTSTPISTQHASQQSNEPIPNSTGDNNETIYLHTKPHHPGLKGYHYWQSTINSLYRIYAVPHYSYPNNNNNNNNEEGSSNTSFLKAVLPMHPSSERGQVPIDLEVTNRTNHEVIHVFWMDYSGKEVYKGSMRRGETWNQTTYIGHPWIFRVGDVGEGGVGVWNDGNEETVLLKYVPFRVVPSIPGAETVHPPPQKNIQFHGPVVGMQRFTLRNVPEGYGLIINGSRWKPACVVEDGILPEPPLVLVRSERRVNDPFAAKCYDEWGHYNSNNPAQIEAYNTAMREIYTAIKWSCQQIEREEASSPGCGIAAIKRLRQYLSNISTHPNEPKYRKLRISNPIFQKNVYNTGARGVLLALGFEEHCGYLECGAADGQMLTQDRIKMVSDAMVILSTAMGRMERQYESETSGDGGDMQPIGADGFGRAGFGYAGSMNRFL